MKTKGGKYKVLQAIFSEAARLGIPQEALREDIPQSLIGRRLSQATAGELIRVLEHVRGIHSVPIVACKRYESSKRGLIQEVVDLARRRYGAEYSIPLNNLCVKFGKDDGFRALPVAHLKELKKTLIRYQENDPWVNGVRVSRDEK